MSAAHESETQAPAGRSSPPWRTPKDVALDLLVTAGGLGHAPVASGTFGTLGGMALAAWVGTQWPGAYLPILAGLVVVLCLAGAAAGQWAERHYGRKDPGQYVLDEVVGYLVAAAWIGFPGWSHLGAAFLLFRLTDIVKPPPARSLEKVPGGWGILLDDLVAGLWAFAGLLLLRILFPSLIGT